MKTKIVLFNLYLLLVGMFFTSIYCSGGLQGGTCIKKLDNIIFACILALNIIGGFFYQAKTNKKIMPQVVISLGIFSVLYLILATLHSILVTGIF